MVRFVLMVGIEPTQTFIYQKEKVVRAMLIKYCTSHNFWTLFVDLVNQDLIILIKRAFFFKEKKKAL